MKKLLLLLTISLATLQSFAQTVYCVWDSITFEESYAYIVNGTSNQNIWQIGKPSKIIFDSAYSSNSAMVTDTLNNYPLNNNSHFDLKIGEFNFHTSYDCNVFIEIKHKFDTDTLKDGGFITVSYDNGLTWANIINDNATYFEARPDNNGFNGLNLYTENDTLFNGEYGFSGKSNGWQTTRFAWFNMPMKNTLDFLGDTMIIRFNFISDDIENNREGWMIDNIKLYSVDLGDGIDEPKPLEFNLSPNPMNETSMIELTNYREVELSILDIQGRVVRQQTYFNNQSIVINKDELNSGIYFVKLKESGNLIGFRKMIIK